MEARRKKEGEEFSWLTSEFGLAYIFARGAQVVTGAAGIIWGIGRFSISRGYTTLDWLSLSGLYIVQKGILHLGNQSSNPDLLPGTLYMMILRTLNQGPLHGYAIAKHIHDWSKGGLEIEDGSLYPALNRMLGKGWVKAEWGITENNRKARFYRLTAAGKKQLNAESSAFNKMIRAIRMVMRTS
jgi:transcriptional regulator